jgi:hypothetical protein
MLYRDFNSKLGRFFWPIEAVESTLSTGKSDRLALSADCPRPVASMILSRSVSIAAAHIERPFSTEKLNT